MKKLLIFVCAIIGLTVVDVSSAEARPGWRRRARVTYYAPAQTTVTAEGQTATGNRTYSYEPSVTNYRSYSPGRSSGPRTSLDGFNDAGFKARSY